MIYVRKHYKYLDKKVEPINECISKRKDAMYHQLIGLIVTGSQSILLSMFVGLEEASIYAVYNVVFSGLQSICVQISNSVVPFLGKSYALNKNEVIERFDLFEFVFIIFITIVFAVAFVMLNSFIAIYTKGADINYTDNILTILFVTRGFANTFRLPAQGMINAAGFFAETKKAATIEAFLCIVTEVILVQFIGIYGVMIGNIISAIWRGFEMILFTNKNIISRKSKKSIIRIIKSIICISLIYGIFSIFLNFENIEGYIKWILSACIVGIISTIIISGINVFGEKKKIKKVIELII